MSKSVIGALRVNLGLDSAQFERGAKRAQSSAQKLQSDFRRMALVAASVGAALGAMAQRGAAEWTGWPRLAAGSTRPSPECARWSWPRVRRAFRSAA
jgi:hypothetical protein